MRNDGLNAHAENSTRATGSIVYIQAHFDLSGLISLLGVVVAHPPGKWKAQVRFLAVDQKLSTLLSSLAVET